MGTSSTTYFRSDLENMISVASENNISTAKKRDKAPFKVNGQSHIILQQLSCGTRSKVSFVSNSAQSPDAAAWILR
jgi:predicted ATP-binding protein involved in virulence